MIKAVLKKPKGPDVVLLGISEGNVKRLKAAEPILVNGAEIGLAHDIMIIYGATENAIVDGMRAAGFVIPDTVRLSADDA